ncbi:MAG: DUF4291 domain-containing protein [Oscillospiraceae bacterium]|nr:DUF4291 domain-containing protein [Oscillospiraceae bacterium]
METGNEIYAQYDNRTIRVYQAYNPVIAQEALRLQTFGTHFSLSRMTWIKPSFLWMMYRCGWCSKKDQEMTLALDIRREVFDELLRQAVLTHPADGMDGAAWRQKLDTSPVRVQWDPDRRPDGSPLGRRAIQMGVRDTAVTQMLGGIVRIEDMTPLVKKWDAKRRAGTLDRSELPRERLYPVTDPEICRNLVIR